MTAQLNHTIVWCRDQEKSANFLAEILDRPAPTRFGPFHVVALDNDVSLRLFRGVGFVDEATGARAGIECLVLAREAVPGAVRA